MKKIFDFNSSPAWLDAQLNNRLRVPNFAQYVERWQRQSAAARSSQTCHLDMTYGTGGAAQALDIFPCENAKNAKHGKHQSPVLVFIHGGYWRSLDKADFSFVSSSFTAAGACVVIPNYSLCPAVTIEQIVREQVQALVWVYRHIAAYGGDPRRITVIGHSAGGHLAAMLAACQWKKVAADLPRNVVRNALSLSGLHDLEPLRHSPYLQGDLRLTPAVVARCSPAYFTAPQCPLIALCGGDESDEFIRQNRLIEQAWGKRAVPICEEVPQENHFSVLDALCTPMHRAYMLAHSLLKP